jgi:hypothetical protein
MTAPTPDIAGFIAAQDRMRQVFGRDVPFNVPVAPVWPVDTQLDENGEPYDPTVVPSSGGGTAPSVIHVGVVRNALPTNEEDEVDRGVSGAVKTAPCSSSRPPTTPRSRRPRASSWTA